MLKPLYRRVKRFLMPKKVDLPLSQPMEAASVTEPSRSRYVSVYAFLPSTGKLRLSQDRQALLDFFALKLNNLKFSPSITPVFLQQQLALRYSRFRHPQHIILKVVVPDTAVAGRSHNLLIRPGVITPQHVHGCFLGGKNQSTYLENPLFDPSLNPETPPNN